MDRSGRSLAIFFALAFVITWACFITAATVVPYRTAAGRMLVLLGAYSPSIAALIVTRAWAGTEESRRLLSGLTHLRVGAGWYLFAAVWVVVLKLTAAVVHRAALGAWPRFALESIALIPLSIVVSWPFQAGEELGWRGFALPRLARRLGLPAASLLLGAVWAAWHLPQFFIAGADTNHQSFPAYALGVTAISVVFAWVYARTNGSLPIVMLMHSAYNNSKDIVPAASGPPPGVFSFGASPTTWITIALLWAGAMTCLIDMKRSRLRLED